MSLTLAPPEAVDAFVLAGGESRRMGANKALLPLGTTTVLGRVLAAAAAVSSRVVLVANDPVTYGRFGVPIVPDRWPGCAALGGIGTALGHAATPRALVLGCDLPFVTAAFLRWLIALDPAADVTLAETAERGPHPLCAVYARSCLGPIERRIEAGTLKVIGFFPEVRVRRASETELLAAGFALDVLRNLNTREDYAAAERAVAAEGK